MPTRERRAADHAIAKKISRLTDAVFEEVDAVGKQRHRADRQRHRELDAEIAEIEQRDGEHDPAQRTVDCRCGHRLTRGNATATISTAGPGNTTLRPDDRLAQRLAAISAKIAPCGSLPWMIQPPPGTSIGSNRTVPPFSFSLATAASSAGTVK